MNYDSGQDRLLVGRQEEFWPEKEAACLFIGQFGSSKNNPHTR